MLVFVFAFLLLSVVGQAQNADVLLGEASRDLMVGRYTEARSMVEAVLRSQPANERAKALLKMIAMAESKVLTPKNYVLPEVKYDGPLNTVLDDLVKRAVETSGGAFHLNLVRLFPPEWGQKAIALDLRDVPLLVVLQNVADIAGLKMTRERSAYVLRPKVALAAAAVMVPPPAPAPLPPPVENDPSALPLPEFLANAIVVKERTHLSELKVANLAAAAPELEDATPGRMLGYVRAGYVAEITRFQSGVTGLSARLPVPFGGQTLAYVTTASFVRFNKLDSPNKTWVIPRGGGPARILGLAELEKPFTPRTLRVYVPTRETELLNPFDRQDAILSNVAGAMRDAWTFQPAVSKEQPFGLVRTDGGYFVGYLRERASGPPRFTWEQLARESTWRFRLKTEPRNAGLQKGTRIFEMADLQASKRPVRLIDAPIEVQLVPRLYETLLRSGMAGVRTELDTPIDDGTEDAPLAPPRAPGDKQPQEIGKETRLNSVLARFLQREPAKTHLTIEYVQEERPIYALADGAITRGSWKTSRLQKTVAFENDPDGALRLTDGNLIYELSPIGSTGAKLTVYSVEESPRFVPNR